MQRKRRNINFGYFSGSSGKSRLDSSITKLTLHSVPTVRMSESNKKSSVVSSDTFCGKIVNSANVTWWRSPKAALRAFHVRRFGKLRVNSAFLSLPRVFRIPRGAVIRTRASQTFMVPSGGIKRSSAYTKHTWSSREMTPLSRLVRYPKYIRNYINQISTTLLGKWGGYVKLPLYIICTLLLSFVVSSMMNGFNGECYAAVNPTASLSVSNPTLSTTVAPGDTAYLSSNVTYSASDIDSYTLQVSYANGYNSLKLDGGTTTLSGANGTSGSSLANNSWGFAWTNNTTNNTSTNAGLTYYTVPTYGTNGSGLSTGRLENVTLPESANNTLDSTTKRIVFAAKFAENNNNSGHYKTGVQLSMVATPKTAVDLSGVTTMQELNGHPEICADTSLISDQKYSEAYTLKDVRDGNIYTVRKFADGRCWMTENLRINNTTLKAASSDFSGSDIELPNSAKSDFTDANKFSYRSYLSTTSDGANAGVSGYYNWYTATAGAGNSSVTTQNQNVNISICPKGWTLPSGGSDTANSDFGKFATANSIGNNSTGSSLIQNDIYNFKYTGIVTNGSLASTSYGYWWSSTARDAVGAYDLFIYSSGVGPGAGGNDRYVGFAVRCIARN